jgi:hypothetical protein
MRQHKSYSTCKGLRKQTRNLVTVPLSRSEQFFLTGTGDGPHAAIPKRQQANSFAKKKIDSSKTVKWLSTVPIVSTCLTIVSLLSKA